MPVCLSVCVSVLPSSLSEAATALQSGGHASHPQENLQGTVRLSLRRLNDQLTSVLDCCLRVFLVSSTPGQTHTGTDAHSLLHKQTQFDFLVFPECRSHSHSELLTQSHETLSPGYVDTLQLVSRSVSFFFFFFLMQT